MVANASPQTLRGAGNCADRNMQSTKSVVLCIFILWESCS